MVLTEYDQKWILNYFISAVDRFHNKHLELYFGFHSFGPFIKLTWHRAAVPGEKAFVYTVRLK